MTKPNQDLESLEQAMGVEEPEIFIPGNISENLGAIAGGFDAFAQAFGNTVGLSNEFGKAVIELSNALLTMYPPNDKDQDRRFRMYKRRYARGAKRKKK